ncbi:hypothetical protein [Marinobacter sp. CHS3-4]|uniref:hypothetical protein n=1 Tax=Marinobacter sp. CHS3-4 TaxID=3045174 RepID=UPI0024B4C118|nr:hypothetical protein [Marinobacter sp. CHS3-4]MDI9244830.1 hypothetical protein [Marinobacter sp. CHS3-4]
MNDTFLLIFFVNLGIYFWFLKKYFKSLDLVLEALPDSRASEATGSVSGTPSKLSLLSDLKFLISLYRRSYKSNSSGEFVKAMDAARRYLMTLAPLTLIAFLLPIIAKFY